MYSTEKPLFIEDLLKGMAPPMRTWLTVRNDDIFSFCWDDRDFAHQYVTKALALVAELLPLQGENKEHRMTLGSCQATACLGHYYAQKMLDVCDLALFDQSGEAGQQASALGHLQAALEHWTKYTDVATSQYKSQKLGRVGVVDLNKLTAKVEADIALAKGWTKGSVKGNGEERRGDINFQP